MRFPKPVASLVQQAVIAKEGVNFGNHTSLLVVDTTPLVGNFFEAYLEVSKDTNVPMKYVPLFADDGHQEWFSGYFHQELTKRFLQDSLKIPGSSRHVGFGRACLGKEYSKELGVTWLRYFARLPSEPPLVFQFKEISIPWLRPFARLPSQPPCGAHGIQAGASCLEAVLVGQGQWFIAPVVAALPSLPSVAVIC